MTGQEAHHLTQVLRVGSGTLVTAFDGRGHEADGVVIEADAARLTVELQEVRPSELEAQLKVTVAVSLLKGDKLSDVVRHCTELGAVCFQPVLSRRSDVPELSANKLERLRRVAREAAKQSGRSLVPTVAEPLPLGALQWSGIAVVAHPQAARTLAEQSYSHATVTIITGPEGGFEQGELADLEERGATPVRLGNRILRAETAPVALLAALLVPEAL